MNKIVSINGLSHQYTDIPVLNNISFDVNEHEFVTLIGPSGCGKSTLFRVLTKLETDFEGEIKLFNQDIKAYSDSVGFMPQNDLLLPWRTLYDNVILPLELSNKDIIQEEILSLIDTFQLKGFESHYPHQLSGGMRQRAGLLRTFLMSKELMLLDEPFAALDYLTKRKLQKWLKDVFKELKKTVIFITHDIEEAINLSDRIIVLSSLPATKMKAFEVKDIDSNSENENILQKYHTIKKEIISLIE